MTINTVLICLSTDKNNKKVDMIQTTIKIINQTIIKDKTHLKRTISDKITNKEIKIKIMMETSKEETMKETEEEETTEVDSDKAIMMVDSDKAIMMVDSEDKEVVMMVDLEEEETIKEDSEGKRETGIMKDKEMTELRTV